MVSVTLRSIIIGLILGAVLAAVGYLNDWSLKLPFLANNLIIPGVIGLLLIGLLVVGPLVGRLGLRALSGAEWAVVLALMMAGAVVPGPALGWHFGDVLVRPHQYAEQLPGWRSQRLLEYAPPVMLVDASTGREAVVGSFVTGLDLKGEGLGAAVGSVPWYAWRKTLTFWIPLVVLIFVGLVCLTGAVHPQWAHNEQISYPAGQFLSALIGGDQPGGVFRSRRFWLGLCLSGGILLINGLNVWLKGRAITIPLSLDLSPITRALPVINELPGLTRAWLLSPKIFFAGLAFAYLVRSDVSFSIGISTLAYAAFFLVYTEAGGRWEFAILDGAGWSHMVTGSYVAFTVMLLYAGRRYYGQMLLAALVPGRASEASRSTVWFFRMGLVCAAAAVVLLRLATGLGVLPAALFVLCLGLLFLVLTRVHTETGIFVIQPFWWPLGPVLGLLGIKWLGPQAVLIMGILSAMFVYDPRCALMPLVANAFYVGDRKGVAPGRMARWLAWMLVVVVVVGLLAVIVTQYAFGAGGHFFWGFRIAQYPYDMLARNLQVFQQVPAPDQVYQAGALSCSSEFLSWAAVGFGLVMVTAVLRLRFTWWPLHPVLFLIWCSDTIRPLVATFLLGWIIKGAVVRFGGRRAYEDHKPLFIGLAAGEFLAAIGWAAVGVVNYLATGTAGKVIRIHPF